MLARSAIFASVILTTSLVYAPDMASATGGLRSVSAGTCTGQHSGLADGFVNPPSAARPAAYWVWVNGLTDRRQMSLELQELKAKGMSGVYIFDVGARDPKGIVPKGPAFMGPESLKAIGHAVRQATRIGLDVGLVTSSSWNCGGPWVTPEYASMGLYHCETTVEGPAKFSDTLAFPSVPQKAPRGPDGSPVYRKDVAVLAVPQPTIEDTNEIVDLTDRVDENGQLIWDVPPGRWTVMRFVCANTGLSLKMPSPNSHGLAIDHFNPRATRMHFAYLIDLLRQELGTFKNTALKYMYVCSYELSGSTWTPDLPEEFKERRGYDMTKYLPVLAGATIESTEITERFRYDFRKTLGELLVDAFYKTAKEVSNQCGLLLCAEAGGPGPPLHQVPVDALKALGVLDIPRGEFWKDHNVWVVKETACASHIYGKNIVDMEAFTSWRHWQDGPFDLKPLADRALCGGANHFTFHTCAHNPPGAGLPGWVYHAGTHISPSIAWWPKAKPFIDYLSRCCYLLQQGLFVADVCYYYGDQGFNFVPPKHVDPSLGYGYDYDVTNAEVLLTRMDVKDGRIVLPDGMSYELLVLADRQDIDWDVLRKIERLVKAGATVVGPKPTKCNGLTDYPRRDLKVRDMGNRLWGPCNGKECREHTYGKGRVVWGKTLREVLQDRGVVPDFNPPVIGQDTLDYIHRRTDEEDIYFVINKTMHRQDVDCLFRVRGKVPELWMPDTGQICAQLVYDSVQSGTRVPVQLPPAGSAFIVFRKQADNDRIVSIKANNVTVSTIQEESGQVETQIRGRWEVRFPEGCGAPTSRLFPELISWTEDSEDGVKYFSGIATYYKEFELSADQLRADRRTFLDLGRVRFVADVYLNDNHLGILWKPPFRVDITPAAKPGKNQLVVEVANTWSNRLTGDANSPQGHRYCQTNITCSLTWRVPWKDTPLLESGLLGPVRLLSQDTSKTPRGLGSAPR